MRNLIAIVLLVSVLLTACAAGGEKIEPTPLPPQMEWEDAVSLLNTGEVMQVTQLHNKTVYLTLKDGQETMTVEPALDDIFDQIQKCGAPCSNIVLAME
jgi:hypothetical protein